MVPNFLDSTLSLLLDLMIYYFAQFLNLLTNLSRLLLSWDYFHLWLFCLLLAFEFEAERRQLW